MATEKDEQMIKFFEILDRSTFIPVVAIKMSSNNRRIKFLLSSAGFVNRNNCVLMSSLEHPVANWDIYCWGKNNRTFSVAHDYIAKNFDNLEDGSVIDVEYILGETQKPKKSEEFYTNKFLNNF